MDPAFFFQLHGSSLLGILTYKVQIFFIGKIIPGRDGSCPQIPGRRQRSLVLLKLIINHFCP